MKNRNLMIEALLWAILGVVMHSIYPSERMSYYKAPTEMVFFFIPLFGRCVYLMVLFFMSVAKTTTSWFEKGFEKVMPRDGQHENK